MTKQEIIQMVDRYKVKFYTMVNDYNKIQTLLMKNYPEELKDYKPEYVQNQVQIKIRTNAINAKKEAETYLKDVESYLWHAANKVHSTKFPLMAEGDVNKRLLAESIHQRAFNFLNTTKDKARIEAELRNALLIDDNYFSSLVELITAKIPTDKVEFSNLDQADINFYKTVNEINSKFEIKTGLNELKKAADDLDFLQKESKSFYRALESGVPIYFSKATVQSMRAEEVSEVVDSVNQSAQFWE